VSTPSREVTDAVVGLAGMVRTRARRVYREADDLRRLAARMEQAAELLQRETGTDTREGNDAE